LKKRKRAVSMDWHERASTCETKCRRVATARGGLRVLQKQKGTEGRCGYLLFTPRCPSNIRAQLEPQLHKQRGPAIALAPYRSLSAMQSGWPENPATDLLAGVRGENSPRAPYLPVLWKNPARKKKAWSREHEEAITGYRLRIRQLPSSRFVHSREDFPLRETFPTPLPWNARLKRASAARTL
jgi:hypothetical protein